MRAVLIDRFCFSNTACSRIVSLGRGIWRTSRLRLSLPDAGFDVWMANSRGTPSSQKHIGYGPDEARFWNF
ncbi:hypothetical protein OSTOST_14026, partial [Ostertagia ostertagi]